jgi:hypothetical protein
MLRIKDTFYVLLALQQMKTYAHIKSIYFPSFMLWAFGESWERTRVSYLSDLWHLKHPNMMPIPSSRKFLDIMLIMMDWYSQMQKSESNEH